MTRPRCVAAENARLSGHALHALVVVREVDDPVPPVAGPSGHAVVDRMDRLDDAGVAAGANTSISSRRYSPGGRWVSNPRPSAWQ
jgi:hypothetical protein